ncbi:hypothetical protein [Polyangium aurulentum]|uniref:hypothetical protein n=1 Tax=Polyangium aurulentum TaxID=2567896 RepID=UPI0010ADD23D|nr:hypothetical protein [Polyangium aurulentum]UQA55926.1 hypothetical protein E8A73_031965 [Polyangium aurulentum]
MEVDPDAPKEPPPEPPPLPPTKEGDWGVGGAEEEGKFAPQGKTGALKREQEEKEEEGKAEDLRALPPRDAGLDVVIGFGKIRDVRNNSNPTSATVASFVPFFEWRVSEMWAFGVRLPVSTGSVDGPLGEADNYSVSALGNLEASLRATIKLKRRLRLPVSIAFTLPTGQGDMYPEQADAGAKPQALVQQAAAGSRGWEEQSLFTPRRLGIVPSVGIRYDTRDMHIAASTKLELMIRTGGGTPASETEGTIHNPALNWVTGASFFYDFLDGKVSPGLRAWLAVTTLPVSVGTSDYSGAQFVIEPDVASTIFINPNLAVRAGVGYVVPLGGHLGGTDAAFISGLRLRAGLAF